MVKACLYLEGGATGTNSKYLDAMCTKAFHKLLDRMGFTGRKPRLVACGGRDDVLKNFKTALRNRDADYIAMWIDSEEPMADVNQAWEHLAAVTTVAAWERPAGVTDEQVLFMTTCMETWIVADRATLREHYKQGFNVNPLPHMNQLETTDRHAVQSALEIATKNCKNAYAKGKRSFDIMEKIDPQALETLGSFARVRRILNAKLKQS